MLNLKAQIQFNNLSHNLSTRHELRPGINFGNGIIFSGTIITDSDVEEIISDRYYEVLIEFPTIEHEAYRTIKHLIVADGKFVIQIASKIIGSGKIIDYKYSIIE